MTRRRSSGKTQNVTKQEPKQNTNSNNPPIILKVGIWHMLRDSIISSMEKGVFLGFGFLVVVILTLWKMPGGDVSKLIFTIYNDLKTCDIVGWFFFFLVLISWRVHVKSIQTKFLEETDRIGKEKSEMQNELSGRHFTSSEE